MVTSNIRARWKWYIFTQHHRSFSDRMVNIFNWCALLLFFFSCLMLKFVLSCCYLSCFAMFIYRNSLSNVHNFLFYICRCDGITTVPLLVPLTGWLPYPLPSQVNKYYLTKLFGLLQSNFFLSFFLVCFFSLSFESSDSNDDCIWNWLDSFNFDGAVQATFNYCTTSWRCSTMAYYEQ